MPAFLGGGAADGSGDRLGMKWVLGFPANNDRGLPAIHGLLLLNDPLTGVPTAILDAGPITAERTAAVSGVAVRAFAPPVSGRATRVALIGAGVQGHSHVPVLGHVLPGLELAVFDRDPGRAASLADAARATEGVAAAGSPGSAGCGGWRRRRRHRGLVRAAAGAPSHDQRLAGPRDAGRPG
jgi:ornithine cyclodeaminase/alanine dehydrogenase-like protein (mu-crystallin family)